MLYEVKLPQWGMAQDEASVATWLVEVGQSVTEGDVLAEVETAKAQVELLAPTSGVVASLLFEPDELIDIGTVVAHIETGQ